jgi:hypothetical protein
MSVFNEQGPTSPQDPLHYAPRRRAERSGIRLSSVGSSAGETRFDRPFSVDPSSSPFAESGSLDAQLEDAISESLRRHLDPQRVPEPPAFARERPRRGKLLMVGGGIAASVGVAAVVALLLVVVMRDHSIGSGFAAAAEFVLPHGNEAAKPASQPRSVLAFGESSQTVTPEQSQELLDRFVKWRQKADGAQH